MPVTRRITADQRTGDRGVEVMVEAHARSAGKYLPVTEDVLYVFVAGDGVKVAPFEIYHRPHVAQHAVHREWVEQILVAPDIDIGNRDGA